MVKFDKLFFKKMNFNKRVEMIDNRKNCWTHSNRALQDIQPMVILKYEYINVQCYIQVYTINNLPIFLKISVSNSEFYVHRISLLQLLLWYNLCK